MFKEKVGKLIGKNILVFTFLFALSIDSYSQIPSCKSSEYIKNIKVLRIDTFEIDFQKEETDSYLWKFIGLSQRDEKCKIINSENIKEDYISYTNEIIFRADSLGLDTISLIKSFSLMDSYDIQNIDLLPIGAFHITEMKMWIIVCVWEHKNFNFLGHVRAWMIDYKDEKIVGFTTCD